MQQPSHTLLTRFILNLLNEINPQHVIFQYRNIIETAAAALDDQLDLEFVNVEGIQSDDPHADATFDYDDIPHKLQSIPGRKSMNLTSFTHFIDIRKGQGFFDGFDGYSPASSQYGEIMSLAEEMIGPWGALLGFVTGTVDSGITSWFNDEYVHAPGQKWYQPGKCSVAIERYCSPSDDLPRRFPMAGWSVGTPGHGYPASTFPPVDNLAFYWDNILCKDGTERNWEALGFVLHALQDASIPQHAAGYLGNWHSYYESDIQRLLPKLLADPSFADSIKSLSKRWLENDAEPTVIDVNTMPGRHWSIKQMVTWMATHAFDSYATIYRSYHDGYFFDEENATKLCALSGALSALYIRTRLSVMPVMVEPPPEPPLRLKATPEMIHFRNVPRGYSRNETVTLKNLGKKEIKIKHIYLTDNADGRFQIFADSLDNYSLDPGASVCFGVSFGPKIEELPIIAHPLIVKNSSLDGAFQEHTGKVRILSSAVNAPTDIGLIGGGIPTEHVISQELEDLVNGHFHHPGVEIEPVLPGPVEMPEPVPLPFPIEPVITLNNQLHRLRAFYDLQKKKRKH